MFLPEPLNRRVRQKKWLGYWLLPCFFVTMMARAQSIEGHLDRFSKWERFVELESFYQSRQFQYAWVGYPQRQQQLMDLVHSSIPSFGLDSDYQQAFFTGYRVGQPLFSTVDSVECELRFSDAALHLLLDLGYGQAPAFGYDGLQVRPSPGIMGPRLADALASSDWTALFWAVQPDTREYGSCLALLHRLQARFDEKGFRDVKIVSPKVDAFNKPLLQRLYQLGVTDSVLNVVESKTLNALVIRAQHLFDLLSDGVLRSTTLQAFNVPLKQRIAELRRGLGYLRWMEMVKSGGPVLFLNIPAAEFDVYLYGKRLLQSKVIVGKPSTPTPTLSSVIKEVILYPYWNVPHKIATRELLPLIQQNRSFLESGNYQVLNKSGRVLDPSRINWSSLNAGYFPYIIRQSTGCDNALGIVKFNFFNPFTVYLHDTPGKELFSFNKRYFSHGCMRVEKPLELAHLLLGSNRRAIDTLTVKGCLNRQAPLVVEPEIDLRVVVLYSTVWYTAEGAIRFYDDVYRRLK